MEGRDYCKLHTVAHHAATLLGAEASGRPFHVVLVGVVGADDAGTRLIAEMSEAGMDVPHIRTDPARHICSASPSSIRAVTAAT